MVQYRLSAWLKETRDAIAIAQLAVISFKQLMRG